MTAQQPPRRDSRVFGDAADDPLVLVDEQFGETDLGRLRHTAVTHARDLGLPADRVVAVELVVSELVSNAIEHGGGGGWLRMWSTPTAVHCRVTDRGPGIYEPMAGRPFPEAPRGRGLWLVATYADSLAVDNPLDGGAIVTVTFQRSEPTSQSD